MCAYIIVVGYAWWIPDSLAWFTMNTTKPRRFTMMYSNWWLAFITTKRREGYHVRYVYFCLMLLWVDSRKFCAWLCPDIRTESNSPRNLAWLARESSRDSSHDGCNRLAPIFLSANLLTTPPGVGKKSKSEWCTLWNGNRHSTSNSREVNMALAVMIWLRLNFGDDVILYKLVNVPFYSMIGSSVCGSSDLTS